MSSLQVTFSLVSLSFFTLSHSISSLSYSTPRFSRVYHFLSLSLSLSLSHTHIHTHTHTQSLISLILTLSRLSPSLRSGSSVSSAYQREVQAVQGSTHNRKIRQISNSLYLMNFLKKQCVYLIRAPCHSRARMLRIYRY